MEHSQSAARHRQLDHPDLGHLSVTSDDHQAVMARTGSSHSSLADQLALLQKEIAAQQSHTASTLNTSFKEVTRLVYT